MKLIFWRVYYKLSDLCQAIKYLCQKIFRGYSNPEAYDFYYYHAKYCIPRLERLIKYSNSHPIGMTLEDWHKAINLMITAFWLILRSDVYMLNDYEEADLKLGLDLFREHYLDLWD